MDTNFLQQVINTYGLVPQMDMLQEECAELIQAVSKCKRQLTKEHCIKEETLRHLLEEMADVTIVIEQFKSVYPDIFKEEYRKKMARLLTRFEHEKE